MGITPPTQIATPARSIAALVNPRYCPCSFALPPLPTRELIRCGSGLVISAINVQLSGELFFENFFTGAQITYYLVYCHYLEIN